MSFSSRDEARVGDAAGRGRGEEWCELEPPLIRLAATEVSKQLNVGVGGGGVGSPKSEKMDGFRVMVGTTVKQWRRSSGKGTSRRHRVSMPAADGENGDLASDGCGRGRR